MQCLSRVTTEKRKQLFGDGKHYFYLEMRCGMDIPEGKKVCEMCENKIYKYKYQHSRQFDHGCVNEPITSSSHIYGGEWYEKMKLRYKEPTEDIIKLSIQYQEEARKGVEYKMEVPDKDMPPRKKVEMEPVPTPVPVPVPAPKKRGRKKAPVKTEPPVQVQLQNISQQ